MIEKYHRDDEFILIGQAFDYKILKPENPDSDFFFYQKSPLTIFRDAFITVHR